MSKLNTSIKYNDFPNKSFGLLRTNPKLTSNVKLVVDSSDSISLSSFDANKELSSSEYKRFELHSLGKYSSDISRFYKKLPMISRYSVMRENPDLSVYSEYSKQYENQYNFGAEANTIKLYKEQYRFLAPLWLNKQVPSMFVVYRVERTAYGENEIVDKDNYKGQNNRIMEMLKSSTIVKTFDLTRNSAAGTYIRNHIEDSEFPSGAINFDFNDGEPCVYHGIDLFNGGFVSKEDYIYDDYIRTDGTEIDKNEILSDGFERNGMVFSNILNMEFMFDDPHAVKYKTYRYFGLYVDNIEEGSFEAVGARADGIGFKPGSVDTVYDLTGLSISQDDMLPNLSDFQLPTLNYITDKVGNFYHIKNKGVALGNSLAVEINDFSLFSGFQKKKGTITYNRRNRTFKSFIKIKINEVPNHLDKIFVGNRYAMADASYNMFDYIISADSSLAAGFSSGLTFSNQGDMGQIISAICDSIRYVTKEDQLGVRATSDGIIIEGFVAGSDRDMIMFGIYKNNVSDFVEYDGAKNDNMGLGGGSQWAPGVYGPGSFATNVGLHYYTELGGTSAAAGPTHSTYNSTPDGGGVVWTHIIDFTDWDIRTMVGGAGKNQGILIKGNDFGDIVVGDYIKIFQEKNYVKIIGISLDTGTNYRRVILEKGIEISSDSVCEAYKVFRPSFGKFSAYDIKDLGFDFHRDLSSEIGELDRDVAHSGILDTATGLTDDKGFGYFITDFPNMTEEDLITKNLEQYYNINSNIVDDSATYRIKNQYDRLEENSLKEHAIESRVVPYICEFELKDFSNIRGGKYILNANESMGIYNASVDLGKTEVDGNSGNLEYFDINMVGYWTLALADPSSTFYTSGSTTFTLSEATNPINIKNNLMFSMEESSIGLPGTYHKFDKTKAQDITFDYFSLFSIFNGYHSEYDEVSPAEAIHTIYNLPRKWRDNENIRKYSFVDGDELFHKGLKYILSEDMDEYKFMCIVNFEDDVNDMSTSINITKNEKWKTLSIVIDVRYSQATYTKDTMTHGFMYQFPDLMVANTTTYVDTPIFSNFDFAQSDWPSASSPGDNAILRADQASIDAGNAKFNSQFTRNAAGEYSKILFDIAGVEYEIQVLDIINDTELLVQGFPWDITNNAYETNIASFNGLTAGPYTYKEGGNTALKGLMDNITANRIKERLVESDGVSYVRVKEDGTVSLDDFKLKIEDPVEFIKPSVLMVESDNDKPSVFAMTAGSVGNSLIDKNHKYYTTLKRFNGTYVPLTKNIVTFDSIYNMHKLSYPYRTSVAADFQLTGIAAVISVKDATGWATNGTLIIGSDTIQWITANNPTGPVYNAGTDSWDISIGVVPNPQFTSAIKSGAIVYYNENFTTTFTVQSAIEEERQKLIHAKFNGYGIAFESYKDNIKDYGIIKNMYFHKVNDDADNPIIKLSESSEKQPLYPMVGEIAIDKKDVNIFDSKYTTSFFTKSFSGLVRESVHGTLSPVEDKTFMASNVMKVNDEYSLDLYNHYKMDSVDSLEKIQNSGNNKYTIHWYEDEGRVFADFYLANMVYDKLTSDGILSSFQTTVIPANSYGDITTVEDDLLEYIKHNITPRFIIDSVDVYIIESKIITTTFTQDISNTVGYTKSKSHSIEVFGQGKPGFRLIYAKRPGYNYDFKVCVKIIA